VTHFSYDEIDRRTAMTDAMSRVTWYGYDRLDRLVSVLNPAVSASTPISQQSFTSNGQWTTLTDANTNIVPFAHDGFDRLATTTYPLGSPTIPTAAISERQVQQLCYTFRIPPPIAEHRSIPTRS
jgi:YD repeat-containing protein